MIVHEAYFEESTVEVAVITTVPFAKHVTVPLLTVAILELLVLQLTLCEGLFVPVTVAVKETVVAFAKSISSEFLFNVTDVTVGALALTVTVHEAV